MVTARCTTASRDPECIQCTNGGNFGNAMDRHSRTLTTTAVNCCMACCYATGATAAKMQCKGTTKRTSVNASSSSSSSTTTSTAYTDYDDEVPSEAAAFVASASAAAFVLLVALLAVILSSVAVMSLASLVPTTAAATDVPGPGSQASDYLHRWHNQRVVKQQQQQPYNWHLQHHQLPQQQQLSRLYTGGEEDALRRKRQLFKNKNREPGVVALTFSLIGGTLSDGKEAYRNVSNIIRDTIKEANKVQSTTTAVPSAEGDQMMMAAGNSAENEIATSSTAAAPPVDQKAAGAAVGKLFGRNYRGLRRLFDSELRTALKNSPVNARDFAMELMGSIGQSLRPKNLFSRGPINGDAATTES